MFDKETWKVRVIDWGLAEYYIPFKEYGVRVGTRPYKGTELLINHYYYGYTTDIWSLGTVLAS